MKISKPIDCGQNTLDLRCYVALTYDWHGGKNIEATLLQFVPTEPYERPLAAGDSRKIYYTTNALVVLQTFDKGAVYELPLSQIKIVNEWYDDE